MDGHPARTGAIGASAEIRARLDRAGPGRLAEAVRLIVGHAFEVLDQLQPSEAELDALVQFLTDVGYATDARRQEWVLLADVFGVTAAMGETGPAGATPSTLRGPFYRADAPQLAQGADLSRDGVGVPVWVSLLVSGTDGAPVGGAEVEVWQANAAGRYENQDPDNQPEHNLRGRFTTDAEGRLRFRTIRPGGYTLPDDGPVGQLARRLGLSLDRPAHIHFAVTAPGYRPLVTAIFDESDAAIGRDALFAVQPGLTGRFDMAATGLSLSVALVLAPADPPQPPDMAKG